MVESAALLVFSLLAVVPVAVAVLMGITATTVLTVAVEPLAGIPVLRLVASRTLLREVGLLVALAEMSVGLSAVVVVGGPVALEVTARLRRVLA